MNGFIIIYNYHFMIDIIALQSSSDDSYSDSDIEDDNEDDNYNPPYWPTASPDRLWKERVSEIKVR